MKKKNTKQNFFDKFLSFIDCLPKPTIWLVLKNQIYYLTL